MGKIRKLSEKDFEKYMICDGEKLDEERWREELENGKRIVLVYEENGEILGEVSLLLEDMPKESEGKHARVSQLIVREEYRSRGIGGALLDVLLREGEQMGLTDMEASIYIDNENAIRLYRRKGFTHQVFRGQDETGEYIRLLACLDEPQEEEGIFTFYFAARAMLIAAAVFLLAAMALGPLRYTDLSVAFGVASGFLSAVGMWFGFASWKEEEE